MSLASEPSESSELSEPVSSSSSSSSSAALTSSSSAIISSLSLATCATCCLDRSWFSHCAVDLNRFLHAGQKRSCFFASFASLARSAASSSSWSHFGPSSSCFAHSCSSYVDARRALSFFASLLRRSSAAALSFSALARSPLCAKYRRSRFCANLTS